jgi:hypothetical protein
MAAERHYSLDGPYFNAPKLWRYKGAIYSSAGSQSDFLQFKRWVSKGKRGNAPLWNDKDTFCVLKLDKKGIWYIDESGEGTLMDNDYFALGSGQLGSLVALGLGCDPAQAVTETIRHMEDSGGPVDVMTLGE